MEIPKWANGSWTGLEGAGIEAERRTNDYCLLLDGSLTEITRRIGPLLGGNGKAKRHDGD